MNLGEYRKGYKDGVKASHTPGADVVRAMSVMLETPSYTKGWDDGFEGRDFEPGEKGFWETDESEEESGDEGDSAEDEYQSRSYYHDSGSSSSSESSVSSAPAPLTEAEKTRRILGQIVFAFALVVSLIYDWSNGGYSFGSVLSGLFVATLTYVSFRVIYFLKYWSLLVVAYSVSLVVIELPTVPWQRVLHDVAIADINTLSGLALLYGIYAFFRG